VDSLDCLFKSGEGGGGGGRGGGGGYVCAEPWSGCREYRDGNSEGMAGNLIKFDFAFGTFDVTFANRSIFSQHLAVTVDFPGNLHATLNRSVVRSSGNRAQV